MKSSAVASLLVFALAALAPAAITHAQEREASVPLLRGVPADVHFFTLGTNPKSPDPATEAFWRAASRFVESGAHRDFAQLMMLEMPPDARVQASAAVDEGFRLLGSVEWGKLVEKEVVFAFKLGMPMPEYLFLFRVPEDRAPGHIAAIRECFAGLTRLGGVELGVQEVERTTGKMTILSIPGAPVQFALAAVGDALVFATSSNMAATAMAKLSSGSDDGTVLGKDAVARAAAALPQVRDSYEYFDVHALLSFMSQSIGMASAMIPAGGNEGATAAREFMGLAVAVLQEMDLVESVATAYASDAKSFTTTSRSLFRPEVETSRLAPVYSRQEPWADWARRVPRDATSFSFDPGIDLAALYDVGVEMMKEHVSASGDILARWDGIQAEMGFRVRDDVLACLSGESASVSFPATAGGCALGECVSFMRLERPDAVAAALKDGLGMAARYVKTRGQEMAVVESGGLHEIRVAAFPWIAPVVGVRGNELVVASSKAALARIDRVSRGEEPNILSDPRFAEIGVGRSQKTIAIGYSRLEAAGEPLASILTGVGFFLSLLPEEKDTEAPILAGRFIGKLGAAFREIDFRADVGYEMVEAADGSVVTRNVMRFH